MKDESSHRETDPAHESADKLEQGAKDQPKNELSEKDLEKVSGGRRVAEPSRKNIEIE